MLLFLILFIRIHMVTMKSDEACIYWKDRFPNDVTHICDIASEKWHGMWPYERKPINGGKTNTVGNETTNKYGEITIAKSTSGCNVINGILHCSTGKTKIEVYNALSATQILIDGLSEHVQEIIIQNSGIEYIHPQAFQLLTNLKKLTIVQSKLREIPDLSKCINLIEIDFYDNNIQISRHNATQLPKALIKINLIKNNIRKIPDNFFDLPQLQYLSLADNNILHFPGRSFKNNFELLYLSVDMNKIQSIININFDNINNNKSKFVHFNASNNDISYISPKVLKTLLSLKFLELHNNSMAELPVETFWQLPQLLYLDLVRNKIVVLTSRSIEHCPNLETIRLHSQQEGYKMAAVYFDSLRNLTSLKNLWLSDNALRYFPHPVLFEDGWDSLTNLYVSNNLITSLTSYSITDFPNGAFGYHSTRSKMFKPFQKVPSLSVLEVESNFVSEIKSDVFQYCYNLKNLKLAGNHLEHNSIDEFTFQNTTITQISLANQWGSGIQYIPLFILNNGSLPYLYELDLSGNKITYILKDTFTHLKRLGNLYLQSNRIVAIEDKSFPTQITTLYLSNNEFSFKHSHPFKDLKYLQLFTLDNNKIQMIPDDAFHGLTSLQYFHLSNNKIGRILKIHFKDLYLLSQLYLSNNEIAYIEDGALAAIQRNRLIHMIDLSQNKITSIPITDFWNMQLRYLYLQNNLITKLPSNGFVNITSCDYMYFTQNRITRIESNAFTNIHCTKSIYIGGKNSNPLKYIESFAFNHVATENLDISYASFITIPSNAFVIESISNVFNLADGSISTIESNAFVVKQAINSIYLTRNHIKVLAENIFTSPFYVTNLYLDYNLIRGIHDNAFSGVTIGNQLYLNNNKLPVFPAQALRFFALIKSLDLRENEIQSLTASSLTIFTYLETLNLNKNRITVLPKHVFYNNGNLKTIYLRNNNITSIDSGAFTFKSSPALEKVYLDNVGTGFNAISYLPRFDELPKLKEMYLAGVENMEENSLQNLTSLKILKLGSSILQCDCGVYTSLYSFLIANFGVNNVRSVQCIAPPSLSGFLFDKTNIGGLVTKKNEFICSPKSIIASAPASFTIKLDYIIPTTYAYMNGNESAVSSYYTAVCITEGSPNLQGSSVLNGSSITIYSMEHVQPGTEYACHMYTTLYDGETNKTSAKTKNIYITTRERSEKASKCTLGDTYECVSLTTHVTCVYGCDVIASRSLHVNACIADCCTFCYKHCQLCNSNITGTIDLDITYYDFQATDPDFNNLNYNPTPYKNPKFVFNPFGDWLAISDTPAFDSFSHWFNTESVRNKAVKTKLTLTTTGIKDHVNDKRIYTFWSSQYWPLDGKGFGSQGQKDCYTNKLQNKGFTSAIRTVITYSGNERITLAGGEELWVILNKVLILQIYHDPQSLTIPCKSVVINATETGNYLIPLTGTLVNGVCINMIPTFNEQVFIKLKQNSNFGLDIFHTERFECNSVFFFQQSGNIFVSKLDHSKPRVDYEIDIREDIAVDRILVDMKIADIFNLGPSYTIVLRSGNGQDRFKLNLKKYVPILYFDAPNINHDNDSSNYESQTTLLSDTYIQSVSTVKYQNTTIELCDSSTTIVTQFPIINFGVQEYVSTTDFNVSIILNKPLDYEVTQHYLLQFSVTDNGNFQVGYVTVKINIMDVNDNCPIISDSNYILNPIPPLQVSPLFTLSATDADSGDDGRITYHIQEINESSTISAKSFAIQDARNNTELFWVNKTIEVNKLYQVFAIDNGVPRKGVFITLNITYSETCQKYGKVVIDENTGAVHFIAPKLKVSKYNNSKCTGCAAGSYCPGNGEEIKCGATDETKYKYSYGFSSQCYSCPRGWLCHYGEIVKCAQDTYITCNDTYCPLQCLPCQPGSYCYEGIQYDCQPGTFSDGKGNCQICSPGTFSNTSKASMCQCCPPGYESTYMKTTCKPCLKNQYSKGCDTCKTCFGENCNCNGHPCFQGVTCINVALDDYECGACPAGYYGDGVNCTDINECLVEPCFHLSTCMNLSPGYKCTGCPQGFSGTAPSGVGNENAISNAQRCVDKNECEGDNRCDVNAYCYNTLGSYYCGNCKPGYIGNGNSTCRLGDYCLHGLHSCKENSTCIALAAGKYYCQCNPGFTGNGLECGIDHDNDGVSTYGIPCNKTECNKDNCPYASNSGQDDYDVDTIGDVCDVDDDNDNIIDTEDNCPFYATHDTTDTDGDGVGDACDNCQYVSNPDQRDIDEDKLGDVCDQDIDGDGVLNSLDNCPLISNSLQEDGDIDTIGDVCDNCLKYPSSITVDANQNGYGDICETNNRDRDGDSVLDNYDNCIDIPNAEQNDVDNDGKGDVCDDDSDSDGIKDDVDNCAYVSNPLQEHQLLNVDLKSRAIGDACANDFDNDGIVNQYDTCPKFANINKTSFKDYILVDLSGKSDQPQPRWRLTNKGRDIEQVQKTSRPSMLIGNQRYGEISYSGVMFVNEINVTGDYIGLVFGYQSNKKFYLLLWRHNNDNYLHNTYKAGIKGIQIKLINSTTGPSDFLTNALWHSGDTQDQVRLLWHDPQMQPWLHKTSYKFEIKFKPSLGRMRVIVYQGVEKFVDSGYIYDTSITGGKAGVLTFGQNNVVWSNLLINCQERINEALFFNGVSTYVTLASIQQLSLTSSFTIGVWFKLMVDYSSKILPIICTPKRSLCLYVYNRKIHGRMGGSNISSSMNVPRDTWHHCVLRYDATGHRLSLFLNGSVISHVDDVFPLPWTNPSTLYVGKTIDSYFHGLIDELSLWKVPITDSNVKLYMQQAGLLWPVRQNLISAYYNMDEEESTLLLSDHSNHNNTADVNDGRFVHSYLDKSRFQLSYPSNKRRKKRYVHEEL